MSNYDIPLHFQIGNKQVTMDELAKLPTDTSRLETELKRRYEADLRAPGYLAELKSINSKPASFATVVWDTTCWPARSRRVPAPRSTGCSPGVTGITGHNAAMAIVGDL